MKHAFLIGAYKNPLYLESLINSLDSEKSNIYVHVNAESWIQFKYLATKYQAKSNVHFLHDIKVLWGGSSLLQSIILLIRSALQEKDNQVFHLITGQDILIKPLSELFAFFDGNPNNYLSWLLPNDDIYSFENGGLGRYNYYLLFDLISHCVLRPVSGREHHVSDYLLAGIEGCGYNDQTCFFLAYHDDSGWCGCSSNHGVYCGYYGQHGDSLSHTAGMLWGDWRVCTFESPRSSLNKISSTRQFESKLSLRSFAKSLDKRRIFRKSPRPSLPLKRAPPLISVFSPQGRRGKPPYAVLVTASL